MKAKLSPFVYKIKGKKNYLVFDSIRKLIFQIIPEGDPKELEKQLLKNDLIVETEGVIPLKFTPNVKNYKSNLVLRELHIRITGRCDKECKKCGDIGVCWKEKVDMNMKDIKNIIKQFKHINIELVVIIGGNPLIKMDLVQMIREGIKASGYKVYIKYPGISEGDTIKLRDMGINIVNFVCEDFCINEELMDVDIFNYFYNQQFNPCWGNKLAIDVQGDLKPCLWSTSIIGNINKDDVKNLIFSGKLDYFWELSKDKFEVCKECEFRYLCPDCRVITLKETGSINYKTAYCRYNPSTGERNI